MMELTCKFSNHDINEFILLTHTTTCVITKTENDPNQPQIISKRPQTITNDHKPLTNDDKPSQTTKNHQQTTTNYHKRPQATKNDYKLSANKC